MFRHRRLLAGVTLLAFPLGSQAAGQGAGAGPEASQLEAASSSTALGTKTATTPPPRPANLFSFLRPDALAAELALRHKEASSLPDLLERATRGLVGAPYVLSPLGEGEGEDPDPRLRFDAFDCTTFVETALALARCDDLEALATTLDRIRYRGEPSYAHRRHLVEAEWVPDLIAAGQLVDVTREIGGARTKRYKLEISKDTWAKRRIARSLVLAPADVPWGSYEVDYIPLADIAKLTIPPGTILNVVRTSVPWSPTMVTHQGLVLRSPVDGGLIVRHASPVARRVIDEKLSHLVERYLHPKLDRGWPVVGLSFLRVVDK